MNRIVYGVSSVTHTRTHTHARARAFKICLFYFLWLCSLARAVFLVHEVS
jgi:hypothetical protein